MRHSNYDKEPFVDIQGAFDQVAFEGYEAIAKQLSQHMQRLGSKKTVVTVECYPGVRVQEVKQGLGSYIDFDFVYYSEDFAYDSKAITKLIQNNLTEDRVFGIMSHHQMKDFFSPEKLDQVNREIAGIASGNILIIGVGATLLATPDVLLYADLARWEIQLRYRSKEMGNWKMDNYDEDILRKYKRAFFVEWRVADRLKKNLFDRIDYLLDTNIKDQPKMVEGKAYLDGLEQCSTRPFR
ncbi:MAG: mannose-6-phosphate isomerase, partial [Vallitaleaceae bacterium]|nr:mannose-6-phosphate isomerase [Vallitaleaceae bacterium]